MKRLLTLGFLVLAAGCSSNDDPPPPSLPSVDCAKEVIPNYSEVTIFQKTCVQCHSSTKTGDERKGQGAKIADEDVNFDTFEAAKASAIPAAEELYEGARGAMPPEDSKLDAATADEKHQVLVWAKCGTPP